MRATLTWICPMLCGCTIDLAARWTEVTPPTSYRHPIPGSITDATVVTACPAHDHFRTDPPVADETYGGEMRGYLLRPAVTEGERLYVALTRYTAVTYRPDTCGCRIYQHRDRSTTDVLWAVPHPVHTRKCKDHASDDDQHSAAIENCARKNKAKNWVHARFPALADDAVTWRFQRHDLTGTRQLVLSVPTLTPTQKTTAQAWADTNIGPIKVVIE